VNEFKFVVCNNEGLGLAVLRVPLAQILDDMGVPDLGWNVPPGWGMVRSWVTNICYGLRENYDQPGPYLLVACWEDQSILGIYPIGEPAPEGDNGPFLDREALGAVASLGLWFELGGEILDAAHAGATVGVMPLPQVEVPPAPQWLALVPSVR
jgi:hypothetical protein